MSLLGFDAIARQALGQIPRPSPGPGPGLGNKYKLLVDHLLPTGYYVAGTIITEGVEIPLGWPPSVAVDPLTTGAILAFWKAGPMIVTGDFYPALAPVIYWASVIGQPNVYQLTGAGASLGQVRI